MPRKKRWARLTRAVHSNDNFIHIYPGLDIQDRTLLQFDNYDNHIKCDCQTETPYTLHPVSIRIQSDACYCDISMSSSWAGSD